MPSLIDVTRGGIVKDVNDSHPENALDSIDVTEEGTTIDVRFLQLEKALFLIDAIFDVKFTVFKLIQS